jgi:sec-independent protein translocase protein TatB
VFDVGGGEFIGLGVIALIVLGPEKLPRYAADAARMLRQVRKMANEARDEVTRELGPEMQDLSLSDLNPRALVRKHLLEPVGLDDLDDLTGINDDADDERARRRSTRTEDGTPPPYDEDAT